jgi:cysteine desulfurase/selenocysteine lyase
LPERGGGDTLDVEPTVTAPPRPSFDVDAVRADFPILGESAHGRPLAYLDNASTTQKPRAVIDRLVAFYEHENANVHRGVHELSARATDAYEAARRTAARFLNAGDPREIVFVRGTTEAINLVARSYGRTTVGAADEVLITAMEHHSNIVPWQMLCEETGAALRVAPITDAGELRLDDLERLISPRTRMVAVVHVSNALGTVNPVREIVRMAHARGVPVLVDGAQAVAHTRVDVRALGCDFYAFSGHKVFGPTGIGVLYATGARLEAMPPYQGGGDMIRSVTFERTLYNDVPYKFEAGTPDVAGAVGLAAAIEYVEALGLDRIEAYERDLLRYGAEQLAGIDGLRLTGTAAHRAGVLGFTLDGVHPHDIGTVLDGEGIAIRAGHHCCQPLMARLGVPATARASIACYSTREEIDRLALAIERAREMFA